LIDGKEKEEESRSKWKFEGEEKVQIPWWRRQLQQSATKRVSSIAAKPVTNDGKDGKKSLGCPGEGGSAPSQFQSVQLVQVPLTVVKSINPLLTKLRNLQWTLQLIEWFNYSQGDPQ